MVEGDHKFVCGTWKYSMYDDANYNWVPEAVFYTEVDRRCNGILRNSKVRIATIQSDPDFIVGWACHYGLKLHYAFVRKEYRKLGVFKRLAQDAFGPEKEIDCTHWTGYMNNYRNSKVSYVYRPALLHKTPGFGSSKRYHWERMQREDSRN